MNDSVYKFYKRCIETDTLFCYGAGWLGLQVGQFFQLNHIPFAGFVVSCLEEGKETLLGMPVYELDSLSNTEDATFLIGVTEKYKAEVKSTLSDHGLCRLIEIDSETLESIRESNARHDFNKRAIGKADYYNRYQAAYSFIKCDVSGIAIDFDMGMCYLIDFFIRKRREGRAVYFVGNGGSSGIAMHMTTDFLKNGRMRTIGMHEPSTITCLSNDYGYENVFSKQLEMIATKGDLLVAISSSGNSSNIVKAIEVAKEKGCDVLTLSGFEPDNKICSKGDFNLYVPSCEYGIVESLHNMVLQRVVDGICAEDRRKRKDNRRIDFIVEHATGRVLKIVSALQSRGYQVRIYSLWNTHDVSGVVAKIQRSCYEFISCRDEAELFKHLLRTDAFVIHHYMNWADASLACHILCSIRESLPKYVVEHYDVLNGMYAEIGDDLKLKEKFAFEHADGASFRVFSSDYLEEELGFTFKGKRLDFWDYFSSSEMKNNDISNGSRNEEQELSLVYVGGVPNIEDYPKAFYNCLLDYAKLCAKHHVHLHIYARDEDNFDQRYGLFLDFANSSDYLHFHRPVPYETLLTEIQQYDYGIFPCRGEALKQQEYGYYLERVVTHAMANKFFDYLGAGLPIVACVPRKFSSYLAEKDMLISMAIEDLDFDVLLSRRDEMKRNVVKNRTELCMEKRISELLMFYSEA